MLLQNIFLSLLTFRGNVLNTVFLQYKYITYLWKPLCRIENIFTFLVERKKLSTTGINVRGKIELEEQYFPKCTLLGVPLGALG